MSLFETLSGLAVRHLPRERLLQLRRIYQGTRARLNPLMAAIHGHFGVSELRAHLEEKVGHDYEILMVHSSMNHMLPMFTGDAMGLLRMLEDFVGPERTLVMPAFYLGDPQINDVVESFRRSPVFDVRRTPSQMGVMTELFRRGKGVAQSLHPTHRIAARGPLAQEITAGHMSAGSTFGRGTPFDVMARHDTCIIGIGKPFEVLTQVHHVEDLLAEAFPVPGKLSQVPVTLRDSAKVEHAFELRWRKYDWPRNMWLLRELMAAEKLSEWRFHHVPLFMTRASDVTESLLQAAEMGKTLYQNQETRGQVCVSDGSA